MAQTAYFIGTEEINEATDNATKKRIMKNDGYVSGVGSELEVIENTPAAMNVVVGTGEAWVQGVRYVNSAALEVTVTAADGSNPRIDLIVLRLTWAADTLVAACLAGTPAASPAAPTLTQTDAVWEIALAQVYVAAGETSIETASITDTRDTASCGVAACNLGKITIDADGGMSTNGSEIAMGTAKITGLGDPADDQDAATQAYVLTNPGLLPLDSGKYLTNDGATVSWDDVATFSSIAASDNLLASSDAEITTTSTTYVLLKRIQIPLHIVKGGSIRVKFAIANNNNSSTVYGRLYVNGVAVGTEQSTTSSSASTKSEDITLTGIGAGAFVELWGAVNADTCKVTNFRIYGTETPGAAAAW